VDTSRDTGRGARDPRPLRQRWRAFFRRLDKRLRLGAIKALAAVMASRRARAAPLWSAGLHRVLYLRYDRIGDMVLSTGILRGIVAAQPTVTLDVLASTRNADVLRRNPNVRTVYTIDKSRPWTFAIAIARIRRARYDAVVDAIVTAPSLTTLLLMWASGARHRIGLAGRGVDCALTLPVALLPGALHYVEYSPSLLAAFGADLERGDWRPELFLSVQELAAGSALWDRTGPRGSRLLVNVSAGKPWCYWPEDRFISALGRVRDRHPDMSILIVGAPADAERMARIGAGAGAPVAHTPHFREMMALVAACDFVLTGDTSVTHIASACGKPVLAMFPANGGSLYGPYRNAGRAISTPGPTLECLQLEPVVRALEEMIEAAEPLSRPDRARSVH
jgi:ADP-heptose:LPS heptosyltransferase